MLYRANFDSEINYLRKSFETLEVWHLTLQCNFYDVYLLYFVCLCSQYIAWNQYGTFIIQFWDCTAMRRFLSWHWKMTQFISWQWKVFNSWYDINFSLAFLIWQFCHLCYLS
jgi:hypothetical protein